MEQAEFQQWLWEDGQIVLPLQMIGVIQNINLSPEDIGYLVMGMTCCRQNADPKELAQDKWIKLCLARGWAKWDGQGGNKRIVFTPLWNSLYQFWQDNCRKDQLSHVKKKGDFEYGRILKWIDQERGSLSITLREKQAIQEFNLRYGWNTEFIMAFLQLCFERGAKQVHLYQQIAKKVYENGINSVEGLFSFMNDLDWIQYKVGEIKKCIGQYGGVTSPQREMYLKWYNSWKFGHEIILRAAEETVRTNSPSFKYIDAILHDWYTKGVKDVSDAEEILQQRAQKRQTHANTKKASSSRRINLVDKVDIEKLYGLDE